MNRLFQDLRYALRQLRKSPAFAVVAILSLALGTGANTAIFQLLDAVRLRSLPIPNPKELTEVRIVGGNHGFGINNGTYSQLTRPIWQEIREHHEPFSGVFAWSTQDMRAGRGSDSHPVRALEVSGEFFPVLGIQPLLGRLFRPGDEGTCTISQVVVSYPYWRSQMGGRELGGTGRLVIDGQPAEVVGVTPPGFFGLAVGEGKAVVWQREKSQNKIVAEMGRVIWPSVYLRMTATGGNRFQFALSSDGREWKTVGETAEGGYLPPWDRSVRVALTVGGVVGVEGRFNSFRITPRMNDE